MLIGSKARRRSATVRAMGPCTPMIWIAIGGSSGGTVVALPTRPKLGFSATVPLNCDGMRSDPPRSLPIPSGVIPVASATASPPLDPPGVRDASHGLSVWPPASL